MFLNNQREISSFQLPDTMDAELAERKIDE